MNADAQAVSHTTPSFARESMLLQALEAAEAQVAEQARMLEAVTRSLHVERKLIDALNEENARIHAENERLRREVGAK